MYDLSGAKKNSALGEVYMCCSSWMQTTEEKLKFLVRHSSNNPVIKHLLCFKFCARTAVKKRDSTVGKDISFRHCLVCQTLGNGEGQGSLVCCSPWGHKESEATWRKNNNIVYLVVLMLFTRSLINHLLIICWVSTLFESKYWGYNTKKPTHHVCSHDAFILGWLGTAGKK